MTTVVDPTTSAMTGTETGTETDPIISCVGTVVDNECSGDTPYCVDGFCVGCGDLTSCKDFEPNKPACAPQFGLCVECLTRDDCLNEDKPVCALDTATCVACSEHDQCPETACNLETGRCFPADNVLYVANDVDVCSDAKAGHGLTKDMPLCTLPAALKRAVVGEPLTIKVKPVAKPQNAPGSLPAGNFIVAIVPQDAAMPSLLVSGEPALSVGADNQVFLGTFTINAGNNVPGPALQCEGASLWIDRVRISATGRALEAVDCRVHVRRTVVFGSVEGGLAVGGADPTTAKLWLENSFVTENSGNSFGGLRLQGAASAEILYSTIALNKSVVPPIDCVADWTGNLMVRNAVIVDAGPHFGAACGAPSVSNSFESTQGDKAMLMLDTFSGFQGGVYVARPDGLLMDVAMWKNGDPIADYDDTPRPATDGTSDYAGADRPMM